ncbi:Mannosylfructose-phosphate synthase [subsurface metagenome]
MPSTYEPFGMVAIESMACGTPAVVTSHGGLKAFLVDGQDALVVDPLDTQALAEAILKLLKDKRLCEEISRRGREKALSMFTWERIAQNTLRVIS